MSGHSKWSTIKHKKAIADSRRAANFTKLANAITVAAKQGGGDPTMNFKLRLALEKARAANLPKANIDRAIKRGTGELGGPAVEEVSYEGFGPGNIAILIEGLTDNKNRTGQEVRTAFSKNSGRMAGPGSVAWMFENKGVIGLSATQAKPAEGIEEAIIESGASNYYEQDGQFFVHTDPAELNAVKKNLEEQGIEIQTSELTKEPKETVEVKEESEVEKALKLLEALEDLDDVTEVYTNLSD